MKKKDKPCIFVRTSTKNPKLRGMKKFFRNFLIIVAVEIAAFALASLDAIPFLWKLQVMFIGGIAAGAIIAALDERVLQAKIKVLQKIRENLHIKEITIKD